MRGIVEWIRDRSAETHSAQFELCRHFFLQFFESDLIATPGQLKALLVGVLSIVASLGVIFAQAYYHKYLALQYLDDPAPFHRAVLADLLFFISMTMLGSALATTFQWRSLFPDLRDYLALASLPVRMRQIFGAKFAALLLFMLLVTLAMTLFPSIGFPDLAKGRHGGTMIEHLPGIFLSCSAASLFVFLSLVTMQGVLLNLVPLRYAARVSLAVQAMLLLILIGIVPLVISIPRLAGRMTARPDWAGWAPPLWFLGLEQIIAGNREPIAERLALLGLAALAVAAVTALAAYWWSYRRHRIRVLESAVTGQQSIDLTDLAGEAWIADARSLGAFSYIAKTLLRAEQHRLILAAFAGAGIALIVEGFFGLALGSAPAASARNVVVAAPLALTLFMIGGLRYLFRLPMTLPANWIFRIHEPGHGSRLLAGTGYFLICAVALAALLTLPVEVYFLGLGRGLLASAVCALPAMVLVEIVRLDFHRIPFTSSYLPGTEPLVNSVLPYAIFAVEYVAILGALIAWSIATVPRCAFLCLGLLVLYWRVRQARIETERSVRLEFEEVAEPVVMTLGIEKD